MTMNEIFCMGSKRFPYVYDLKCLPTYIHTHTHTPHERFKSQQVLTKLYELYVPHTFFDTLPG